MAMFRRKHLIFAAPAVLFVGAIVAWEALRVPQLATIGAGYAAQQTCACIFVSRRTKESCQGDLEPLAQKLVSITVGDGEVTAYALGSGQAISRYERGFGCSLRQ
jgi:hypothetical protein